MTVLTRVLHEFPSRDRGEGCATRSAGACAACRATVPRYRGIGSEAYLNGTSQGEPVLSLSKEHPRTPGRTAMSAVAVTPRRDGIPGFIVEYPAMGDVVRAKEKKYYHAVYLQRANDSRKKKEPNRRFSLQ